MKKKIFVAFMSAILLTTPVAGAKAKPVRWLFRNRYYAELLKVTKIEFEGKDVELIHVVNCNGFSYRFWSEDKDWFVGDYLCALMDNRGTPKVKDDKVLAPKYARPDLF